MDRDSDKKSPQTPPRTSEDRRERLAAQLRANLKRRKQQMRARRDAGDGGSGGDIGTNDEKP